jgi:hypothetical protein
MSSCSSRKRGALQASAAWLPAGDPLVYPVELGGNKTSHYVANDLTSRISAVALDRDGTSERPTREGSLLAGRSGPSASPVATTLYPTRRLPDVAALQLEPKAGHKFTQNWEKTCQPIGP